LQKIKDGLIDTTDESCGVKVNTFDDRKNPSIKPGNPKPSGNGGCC